MLYPSLYRAPAQTSVPFRSSGQENKIAVQRCHEETVIQNSGAAVGVTEADADEVGRQRAVPFPQRSAGAPVDGRCGVRPVT